ncbi:MAG: S1 RNA-binding domain-containing protein [Candidatus Eisenbacteria bacterium]|nr:S1 RNA-binding domain-containing protein [Candidatus Eisenbacteria bacterium]
MSHDTESNQMPDEAGSPAEKKRGEDKADFLEVLRDLDTVLPIPDVGQRVHAKILSLGDDTAFLDYGGRSEATMETRHLRKPDGSLQAKIGDTIDAYVVANEDTVVLSPAFIPSHDDGLEILREALRSGAPVSGKVSGVNAGGLEIDLGGRRAFCPVSQIDLGYCPDASVYVGQTLEFKILDLGDKGRRIVVTRRALLQAQRDEAAVKLRASLFVGMEREGTVARLEPFGAFVDLGGIDGMVHVSEISHDRVAHPSESLKAGDRVRVRILELGKDAKGRDRISLSIKAAQQDPWHELPEEIRANAKLSGEVVRMADFGAFVRLRPGIEGLLHISEIGDDTLAHPRDALREGQVIDVKVLSVDPSKRRISLSMRENVEKSPLAHIGKTLEGVVRAHKPYGAFIDLPSLGSRVSGLLPLEEAGVGRGPGLAKRLPLGDRVEVTVLQIDEKGRIRLGIPQTGGAQAAGPAASRGVPSAMAEALRRALQQKDQPAG